MKEFERQMFENDIKVPVVGLILAGGTGQRIGSTVPKQFIKVRGQSILNHTLAAFEGVVDKILVVCHAEWLDQVDNRYATCEAGATGFGSLTNGIAALTNYPDETFVIIHDAVRPLVTREVLESNLDVARTSGNAIASVETYETLLVAPDGDGAVHSMIRREGIFRAQTPQTFTLGTLRKMISEAQRLSITDVQSACVLAQQLGYELHLSLGDLCNFKITTASDLKLYETLTSANSHT